MNRFFEVFRDFFRSFRPVEEKQRQAQPALLRPYAWEESYPEGVDWQLSVTPEPLTRLLDDAVARFSDRPCLEFLGKRLTYAEVGSLVDRAAAGLRDLGVEPGDRIGLFLPNSPYYIICYYAILKAGGTVVNFNPLYAEREIRRQISDADVSLMITMNLKAIYPKVAACLDDTCLEKVITCSMSWILPFPENALFAILRRKEIAAIPSDESHIKFDKLIANEGRCPRISVDPAKDIAVLQYTGGTTGIPKGAMLTHANLHFNTEQTRVWSVGVTPGEEKVLAVLPLFHVFGMTGVMNVGLRCGSEIILLPRFKVSEVMKIIDKERPSIFLGVPTMYSAINGFKERDKFDLSSLRLCLSGGAPLSLQIKKTFEEATGCLLVEGYGLTEAGPVCTINPFDERVKEGSCGLPVPGTVIEIVSLEDPDRVLSPGEHGEICVTGPQVMAGYWKQPGETAETLRGGRLHTGDVGYMDDAGYLYIIDRIKDLIITGGFNVYPRMVEEAILLHPSVEEVAVCGVEHRHHGELVKAFIRLKEEEALTAGELKAFLKDKLAPFETPKRIEFVDDIPKTVVGKPLRRALIAREKAIAAAEEQQTEDSDHRQPNEEEAAVDAAVLENPGDAKDKPAAKEGMTAA